MELRAAQQLLSSASPSQSELAEIYMTVPSLREAVLSHPATSPELRAWLIEQTRAGAIPPAPAPAVAGEASTTGNWAPVPPPPATAPTATTSGPTPGHSQTGSVPQSGGQPYSPTSAPSPVHQGASVQGAGSRTSTLTELVKEIVKDDFTRPMTPRLIPLASRTLWVFNGVVTGAAFLALLISGFKILEYSPLLGLLLILVAIVIGPFEWIVYLIINRLAFELYSNVDVITHKDECK